MANVSLGTVVPDFELPSTGAKMFSLQQVRGQFVIVYFYPKDNTPGCTQEGQAFRDNYSRFSELNALIVGISRDSVKVHEGFKAKQQFPFDLLADTDETVCRLFDVIKPKTMYGKQVIGIERSTFLIAPDGTLLQEWRKVKVNHHCDDVLNALTDYARN